MHSALLFWHEEKKQWCTPLTSDYKLESLGLHYGLKDLEYSKERIITQNLSEYSAAFSVNAVHKAVPISQINDITFPKSNEKMAYLMNTWSKE
jgi:hypothetical protein